MRKEAKAASVAEPLQRLIGELHIKGRVEQAEALTGAMRVLSVEDLARLDDLLRGARAVV